MTNHVVYCFSILLFLSGCTGTIYKPFNDNLIIREGLAGTGGDRSPLPASETEPIISVPMPDIQSPVRQVASGSGKFVEENLSRTGELVEMGKDEITLNFASQPIEAVINTILGDVLKENYSIAQSVVGEVTFSTSKPIDKRQALSILETLLSWTNNALIRQGNRYLVLPAGQAVAGQLIPRLSIPAPDSGLTARLFVLDYISAVEMQKLLRPFSRENAFLLVDATRNVLVMAGTPEELSNYQQTIDIFDVNWLKGMSVGVYALQRASVAELMPELDRLFGSQSETPLAGMLRFLPIDRTNSIVAISSQSDYLMEVGRWIEIIDQGGGNEPQMYVYDVRNLKAVDLAHYLRQMYGNEDAVDEAEGSVAPGLRTLTFSSEHGSGVGSAQVGTANSGSQAGLKPLALSSAQSPLSNAVGLQNSGLNDVRIAAQKSSNQLLIRSRPSQWKELQAAIRRLDNPPMQVQIETRILEVSLTGALSLGVQWYLGRLAGNSSAEGIENMPGSQGALGQGGAALNSRDTLFYSFISNNLQVALHALETSGNTRVLSAPSLVVMNNQEAQIQVGDNIPINQTTINLDNTTINTSSVQYVQTGVILGVVPRINPGGLVYMDIQQQVSNASTITDINGNPTISTRAVSTQVAVRNGQTILLGGLIQQGEAENDSRIPYLGRVSALSWLFGSTRRSQDRSELIVLITPKVIVGDNDAREVTDQYRQQLQLIQPHAAQRDYP